MSFAGNTKATTNSSKSNDDSEKNAKKTANDDAVKSGKGTPLGEIPKIEKYIANTRIDGLQPLYQVRVIWKSSIWFYEICCRSSLIVCVLVFFFLSLDLLSNSWQNKCVEETFAPICWFRI